MKTGKNTWPVGSDEFFAIGLKETGKVIGNIYCGKRDFDSREVGYIINKDHQRAGYVYEALSAVIKAFLHNGTHRIYAECGPRNTASWKLLEKAGLKREAFFHKNIWFHKDHNGGPIRKDTYVYAVLNE